MDKLKKLVKHLFAPAIVLLLVVIMGVFSPVMSVAAALRVNAIVHNEQYQPVISNLPARTVEVNTEIKVPTINIGAVELYHAGVKVEIPAGDTYTYREVGQYEWRFYVNDVLFNTQKVIVTEATYTMSMVDNVVTVAPKDLKTLNLPLPNTYRVDGKAIAVASIEKGTADIHGGSYVIITDEDGKVYTLTATVALENHTFAASKISFDKNGIAIDLSANKTTGNLKVAYQLCNEDGTKDLAILPLKDIEIKNVNKSDVTFANIPDAPSVKNLAYYSSINLTAPTAGSAKVGVTSFNVDAQTKIFKIQCSPYKTEPSDWSKTSDSKIHTLTVEKNSDGDWVVKEENGTVTDAYVEVDGLTVKVKKLGWYRFQFETSTLFGYQLDETVDVDDLNIQQDDAKSYVRYWSNSVHISSDQDKPSFAFVKPYDGEDADVINEMNENFSDLISDYKNYLPMTSQSDSLKVTVNGEGLVLPAIFPHDNATAYNDMSIYSFSISQLRDENGDSVSNNYVRLGDDDSKTTFVYDKSKRLQVLFVENEAERGCENNNVKLLKSKGLYQISITVKESESKYENGDVGGYARSNTQSYYFYFDESYTCGVSDSNSPVVDADNKFQISDLYLWEGKTLELPKPYFSDAHTATNKIQSDYFLVGKKGSDITVLSELDKDASEIDFDNLYKYENGKNTTTKLDVNTLLTNYDNFYVYAVARNFNAMQANLKQDLHVATLADYVYFDAETCFKEFDEDKFAQYGYAWKRAEFKIYSTDSDAIVNNLTAQLDDDDVGVDGDGVNKYEVGQTINIKNVKVQWDTEVDGQMSVAVYHVQENNVLVPVNVVNSDNRNEAKVISSVAYCREEFTLENLYFTPDSKGDYIFVVTVKANASDKVTTLVKNIVIGASNEWSGSFSKKSTSTASSLSTASTSSTSLTVGETLVLPTQYVGPDEEYVAKNRKFYDQSGNELGNYTITVLGVNDPNCLTGNKFTPNKTGRYILRHSYYLTGETEPEFEMDYDPIDVTAVTDGASNIRMGENYKANDILWNAGVTKILSGETGEVAGEKYDLGSGDTGTSKKPAYAITLDQFIMSNYGASTDFVVDSANLYQYLEPLYEDGKLKGYMYPAIAIPMPNLISNNYSSDEVEITVQKSGSGDYLVSSKKKNAGGSNVNTKASVIENIDGFYVFRPEGKFGVDCKDESKYNASNYLTEPNATNVVGVYTVTYKTQSTELSFNITFGNLENGELELKDGFLTYNNDDGNGDQEINSENTNDVVIEEIDGHRYVTIDMSKVNFTKNADMQALIAKGPNPDNDNEGYSEDQYETAYYWENARVTVSFEGSTFIDSTRWSDAEDETEAIKITDDGKFMYKFDLNQGSGTYKVNISLTNKYTKTSVSDSIEFTIDVDATNRSHNLNNVWGVILIVLSLGLLAGVVYYFIKTARATRFIDTPRAVKNKEKVKAPKAPKAEAPKEDVK